MALRFLRPFAFFLKKVHILIMCVISEDTKPGIMKEISNAQKELIPRLSALCMGVKQLFEGIQLFGQVFLFYPGGHTGILLCGIPK